LKAAELAALRGHHVSIYEQEDEFGGQVNIAAKIPFREEIKDVVRFMVKQLEKSGVREHLGERMTAEMIEELDAEVVIVATGARPLSTSGIPGSDASHVHNVWDVLAGRASLGERVVLYDVTRRWSGLGTAEFIANMGKRVDAVTPTFYLGEYIEPGNVALAYQRITERGVNVVPNSELVEIEKGAVVLENVHSRKRWRIENVDSVVLSLGCRSERELYDRLKGKTTKELYFIGDAVAPRLIQQAVLEAEILARKL
jgi:NADPH-dependent 2,4-dienoyl-CoA reductase/sulfur reductase-like enzyme